MKPRDFKVLMDAIGSVAGLAGEPMFEISFYDLTLSQAKKLVERLIEVSSDDEVQQAETLLQLMADYWPEAFAHIDLSEYEEVPPFLFKTAGSATRDTLIKELESPSRRERIAAVNALEWIGDEAARAALAELPPDIHNGSGYVVGIDAGWQLLEGGGRRDLYYKSCFGIVQRDEQPDSGKWGTIVLDCTLDATCGWCDRAVSALIDLNLADPCMAFLGLTGTRLRIGHCYYCSWMESPYFESTTEGHVRWSAYNMRPSAEPFELELDSRTPTAGTLVGPRSPYLAYLIVTAMHVNDHDLEQEALSQIGGFPAWRVIGVLYPTCPKCQQPMPYLGQLEAPLLPALDGGRFCMFLCSDCMITKTMYESF